MKNFIFTFALSVLFIGLPATVSACPSCRDALATADNKDGTPQGGFSLAGEAVSLSVLFMLAMPFGMVTGFGVAFYRLSRPLAQHPTATTSPQSQPVESALA